MTENINERKGKIRGVIFDLDGTLADTMGDLMKSINIMLSRYGLPRRAYSECIDAINRGAVNFVRDSLPPDKAADGSFVAEAFETYKSIYSEHYLDTTHLYDGIYELLTWLKKRGVKLGVLSNKQHSQTALIAERFFGSDFFSAVIGHGMFPHKPDPAASLHIAAVFGAEPTEILFVGDSDIDIATARNAGMFSIAVTWGYKPADVLEAAGADEVISSPDEIKKYF